MARLRNAIKGFRAAMGTVTPEDKRNAWYVQLGTMVVLAGILTGAAFLLGDEDAEWPVPVALVISGFGAVLLARVFAYRRRRR
jgi:hypothetical protein